MQNFDTYQERYITRKKRVRLIIGTFFAIMVLLSGIVVVHTLTAKEAETPKVFVPLLKSHIRLTDKQWTMAKYFQKVGSPVPDKMAVAVCATKKPRLMAAMAKVESTGNPAKRNTGYKKRHSGAWQVNPKDWGLVSHNALDQALQAEFALEEFVKMFKGDIKKALKGYGGDTTDKYQKKILAELVNVPH